MVKKVVSKIFGFIVGQRNKKFDEKESITKCNIPVISVGNLSVGGTGKTPFVQMLAKFFIKKNLKVGIIGKGYKRESKGEILVSDGIDLLVDASTGGDEMVLLAESLKVPVLAHESKSQGALSLQNQFKLDLIIVDDGFQHRELHRDIDIVLIDKDTIDNPVLLPKGRLREPVESLKRADVICLAGNFELPEIFKKYITQDKVIIRVKPIQANPYNIIDRNSWRFPELKEIQKGIIPFAGIAKPKRFFDMLESMGYKLLESKEFDDHHKYSKKDLEYLSDICKKHSNLNLATTEKDAAKLLPYKNYFIENNINCFVFPIALTISEGKDRFFKSLNKLFERTV
jgi:tetraacyldisaccharide 4'-kinase